MLERGRTSLCTDKSMILDPHTGSKRAPRKNREAPVKEALGLGAVEGIIVSRWKLYLSSVC